MMTFDEVLIAAVLVMLIASTYMGFAVRQSLYHSRKAFEALIEEVVNLDEQVERLEHRVADLEPAQTHSRPHPLS
jgi:CHASE1-domain containing sensor protein